MEQHQAPVGVRFEGANLNILLLEGRESERTAIRDALADAYGIPATIVECARIADAEALLSDGFDQFELLLVAATLPDGHGVDFCARQRARPGALPSVILVDRISPELAQFAFHGGITRPLVRDADGAYVSLLPLVLREVVSRHRELRELAESRQRIQDSEIRLRQIVSGSSVATFVIDESHVVTHWNRACEVLTGTPASEMIGTRKQWRAFYPAVRPVLADLVLDRADEPSIGRYYEGKFRKSSLIQGAYEAEDYFPNFGESGRWLYFTAAPLRDASGRLIGAVETLQDFTERRRAEAALRESEERYRLLSITDARTGLFNSRHLQERLEAEIARTLRYHHPLTLMVLDVDDFKRFNDAFGHLAGDGVLSALADVIRHCLRSSDSAYRYGGEEFVVMLPETELAEGRHVAERIRAGFAALETEGAPGVKCRVSVSVGLAAFGAGDDAAAFLRRADTAMYRAKRKGKNCVVVDGD